MTACSWGAPTSWRSWASSAPGRAKVSDRSCSSRAKPASGSPAILGAWGERSRDDGFLVLRGNGDELGATRPFAPLLDALGHGPAGDEARRTVRDRMAQEPTAQLAVLEGLFLDDLHWADASTLATLASLVRRAGDLPLLVALATRPVPRSDSLLAFLDVLDVPPASLRSSRVELGPLGRDEVTALATEILETSPGRDSLTCSKVVPAIRCSWWRCWCRRATRACSRRETASWTPPPRRATFGCRPSCRGRDRRVDHRPDGMERPIACHR